MHHVAIDIGASGGTVYLGTVTETTFDVAEVHRFDNRPVEENGRYVWDIDGLVERIVVGLGAADALADGVDTVAIDTWGLDFGLLQAGEILRNPVSYRDTEVTASRDSLFETVDERQLFDATGITHWNTPNTVLQLYTLAQEEPELLERADSLLMMPQLLSTILGGRAVGEVTVASTTQMVDPRDRAWAVELLEELALPTDVLPPLEDPGVELGPVAADVAADLSRTPELVSTTSHDTASAVAGLPLSERTVFLNTGSWFIVGVERDEPVFTDEAFGHAVGNELGVDGTVRLLKNINGFFLFEECRRAWREEGEPVDYDTLLSNARDSSPRSSFVDPDSDSFGIDGSMPEQIREFCRRTGQHVPHDRGAVVRCLLDSLVTKTAVVVDQLSSVTDEDHETIRLGGGGVRNELFCQLLADATGRPVVAGPVEATAVGNLLTQATATGTLSDVEQGRRLVDEEFQTTTYEPRDVDGWERAKERLTAFELD